MAVARRNVLLRAEVLEDRATPASFNTGAFPGAAAGAAGTTGLPGAAPLVVSGPRDGTAFLYASQVGGRYTTPAAVLRPFGAVAADVRAATADVNADGTPDTVLVTGPGTPLRVAVISGRDNATVLLAPFDPFGGDFAGGGFVAAADFDRDGRAEFVVTPDDGGGARVAIFSLLPAGITRRADYLTLDPDFRGGLRVAAGNVNLDGTPDLVVTAGFGGGPRVTVLDGRRVFTTTGSVAADKLVNDFFVFDAGLRNGMYVAVGDVNGDGFGDLIFGAGPGGGPEVKVVSGQNLLILGAPAAVAAPLSDFFAGGSAADRSGVRVAAVDADGDARADVAVGLASPPRARVYLGKSFVNAGEPAASQDLNPFGGPAAITNVFVG